jgi:hypothetical protein
VGTYLLIGFLEQVSTPEEADIVLGGGPAPVRRAMREQALATISQLTAA